MINVVQKAVVKAEPDRKCLWWKNEDEKFISFSMEGDNVFQNSEEDQTFLQLEEDLGGREICSLKKVELKPLPSTKRNKKRCNGQRRQTPRFIMKLRRHCRFKKRTLPNNTIQPLGIDKTPRPNQNVLVSCNARKNSNAASVAMTSHDSSISQKDLLSTIGENLTCRKT